MAHTPIDIHPIPLLQQLLRYESITPHTCGIYEPITNILQSHGFTCISINKHEVSNLFAYLALGNHSAHIAPLHLCFMGHVDVVPPGSGWSVGAFSGKEQEGYIYGRGAQDMKAGVAASICALIHVASIMRKQASAPCIISLLLTSDEEGDGIYGTHYALQVLKQQQLLPTHAIVTEPTCSVQLGDTIKIGRRGSINGTLTIQGIQGHAAYPHKCKNPVEALGAHLGRLAGIELDSGDRHFAPSKLVITDIRAGLEVSNVTPSSLRILCNVRNSPQSDKARVKHYIESIMRDIEMMEGISCSLTLEQNAKPFLCRIDSKLLATLTHAIEQECAITPSTSTDGGTSDARFCQEFNIEVVEFGVCNDRIHAIDERVKITEVEGLYRVLATCMKHFLTN